MLETSFVLIAKEAWIRVCDVEMTLCIRPNRSISDLQANFEAAFSRCLKVRNELHPKKAVLMKKARNPAQS